MRFVLAALLASAVGCRIEGGAQSVASDTVPGIDTQVAGMLELSAAAWNRGDLDGFMADYLRSPRTTYIGSSGFVAGWEAIRARYAPLFGAGALRDSLRFERVAARPLGREYALATARYVLHRDGRVTGSGPFTLVLWRTEGGWRIVHDQSASDPPPTGSEEGEPEPEDSVSEVGRPDG